MRELAEALATSRRVAEIHDILFALLTPREREAIALRWRLLHLLVRGKSQRAVSAELGISLCKITRGAKELKTGPIGFRRMMQRLATQT